MRHLLSKPGDKFPLLSHFNLYPGIANNSFVMIYISSLIVYKFISHKFSICHPVHPPPTRSRVPVTRPPHQIPNNPLHISYYSFPIIPHKKYHTNYPSFFIHQPHRNLYKQCTPIPYCAQVTGSYSPDHCSTTPSTNVSSPGTLPVLVCACSVGVWGVPPLRPHSLPCDSFRASAGFSRARHTNPKNIKISSVRAASQHPGALRKEHKQT